MKRLREDDNLVVLLPHTKRMREERSLSSNGCSWIRGSLLGKGGFGSVFLAFNINPTTSRFKDLPPVMAVKSVSASSCAELLKEKILLGLLNNNDDCPFIIRSYGEDFTLSPNGNFTLNLFLEYASGGSLANLIEKSKGFGLEENEARGFTKSILKGINCIHEAGYVHCDLKPENVLLVPQGNSSASPFVAKIADLGLAKAAEGLARRSHVRGTIMYLSPEAVTLGVQDQPSDIWALGCTVLCMLTGEKTPWNLKSGEGNHDIKQRISEGFPEIPNGLSKMAKDFLKLCFIRSPSDRPTAHMLLSHPFVSCIFGKGDDEEELKMSGQSVEITSSLLSLSEPGDEFRDGCSFIPLLSSSFRETEEIEGPAISDTMRPKLSTFAVDGAG